MMIRRWTFFLAAGIFLVACYLLYSSLDASNTRRKAFYDRGRKEVEELEDRLKQLESELSKNEKIINEIRANVAGKIADNNAGAKPFREVKPSGSEVSNVFQSKVPLAPVSLSSDTCEFASRKAATDVQMLDIYELLPFDNVDGGVWKQGWDITYDKDVSKSPQLLVYVVPHSHTDPGWIKTFERYYQEQTKLILDNMVIALSKFSDMKFIYAEMSFFERWWKDITDVKRNTVKKLIERGQFEIVTGAWVMTDEANSHYFATIDQMIEGHQWLENHLGYKPTNHWSIDPFGLTSTLSYLLKISNFTSMAVQRVHYSVKKHFAKEKLLEFMWRPVWNSDDKADIFCHMFPFYSYDVPHTCGPDPKICCQFDFRRLPGLGITCPWHVPPVAITTENIEARASMLLDQYRKKAELYRTNVLFVPLGDDFRYDTMEEWEAQYKNYKLLFDYMNSRKDWNVKAQFGTLSDYFTALYSRTGTIAGQKPTDFKVLSGDFFTYADRDDHYWSGYFVSRPFYKRMDRILQNYLRGADILFSLALSAKESVGTEKFPASKIFAELVEARRNLGLVQHHDAITGTAKAHVVVDYGQRMLQAILNCRRIIAMAGYFLLLKDKKSDGNLESTNVPFEFDERIPAHDSNPEKIVLSVDSTSPRLILLYNSLAHVRDEISCIHTETTKIDVQDEIGNSLPLQIGPVIFKDRGRIEISSTIFEICWHATIPPMGIAVFRAFRTEKQVQSNLASLKSGPGVSTSGIFESKKLSMDGFTINTPYHDATFNSSSGFLQTLKSAGSKSAIDINLEFVKYGTTHKNDRSGAYIFLPDGPAVKLPSDHNEVLVVEGPLFAMVHVIMPLVKHTIRLSRIQSIDGQRLQISNLVDITSESNFELAMRFRTGIKNVDRIFYTDLNGFQTVKRKYFEKIPLQGNIYPMPTAAFLEDSSYRFSLFSGQPLGVGSMDVGWLEVILDRRLMQDDNRGLFEPVTDNKITPDYFSLLLENLSHDRKTSADQRVAYHTLMGHHVSLSTLYPPFLLYQKDNTFNAETVKSFSALRNSFPCDMHLVNLRTMEEAQHYSLSSGAIAVQPKSEWALILHRFGIDCQSATAAALACESTSGRVDLSNLFSGWSLTDVEETSLTLMHVLNAKSKPASVTLAPMDIKTFRVKLR